MRGRVGGFGAAALIDRDIDNDGAWLHGRDGPCRNEFGRGSARDQSGTDDDVGGSAEGFDGPGISRHKTDTLAKTLRQAALGLLAACGDGDIGAHADRHLRRIASDDPAAEHHDFGGGHALDAAEQDTAAPLRALQEMGGNLWRHAAGNPGHRRQQRQLSRRIGDGFVGKRRHA